MLTVPSGHRSHLSGTTLNWKPGPQALQPGDPIAQVGRHSLEPTLGDSEAGGHSLQREAPTSFWKVPTGHGLHPSAPSISVNVPGGHILQKKDKREDILEPAGINSKRRLRRRDLNRPFGQGKHSAASNEKVVIPARHSLQRILRCEGERNKTVPMGHITHGSKFSLSFSETLPSGQDWHEKDIGSHENVLMRQRRQGEREPLVKKKRPIGHGTRRERARVGMVPFSHLVHSVALAIMETRAPGSEDIRLRRRIAQGYCVQVRWARASENSTRDPTH